MDIKTLVVNNILVNFTFAVALIFYARKHQRFEGLYKVGFSFIANGVTFILIGLKGQVPAFIPIVVANALIILAICLLYIGIAEFHRAYTSTMGWLSVSLVTLSALSSYFFILVSDNKNVAVLIISLMFVAIYSLTARLILTSKVYNDHFARRFFAYSYMVWAAYFTVRTITTALEFVSDDYVIQPGLMHSLAIVVYQSLVLSTSFSLMWLVSSKLEAELSKQASIDGLTQIYNRRSMEEFGVKECSRALRNKHALSIALLDIDHFKKLNDNYGHPVGDRVLINVAKILQDNIRKHDIVARYGGEEFVLIFPDTPLSDAVQAANKLRICIEDHQTLDDEGLPISVTASFGIACLDDKEDISWSGLVSEADNALYQAKDQGRNRVVASI